MPPSDSKVYVGDIGSSINKEDLEDAFYSYGRMVNVWVARDPPGFAFVEFEDSRDAEDAVRAMDGRWVQDAFIIKKIQLVYLDYKKCSCL